MIDCEREAYERALASANERTEWAKRFYYNLGRQDEKLDRLTSDLDNELAARP